MTTIVLSDEFKSLRPCIEKFIVQLGYSKRSAKLFAEGYIEHAKTLPTLLKLRAINNRYDPCMVAGFRKANLNEDRALAKAKKLGLE